ncbi:MAG TPA: thioredoxin domain-containing protein [Aggregatilinea sp.]|uniref:DsbA family protein n=1 Tax=Aggregatilinea sp. TaxID=2806333 RepID=UPI002CB88CE9|nr:thioredoxin domain-containing protein [Aggregatilinea sp.]HML20384.1 thioredoxin domain-containing protein [Aggregatilinea sp.]
MSHQHVDRLLGEKPPRPPRARPHVPAWLAALGIVALLGIIGAVYYFVRPLDAPIPSDAGALYADLQQDTTPDGYPMLGSPDAPVTVEVFSSFACPHCREFSDDWFPVMHDAIAAGQVQFIYIPVSHIGPGAAEAASAALCAGEQGQFWIMHDVLFAWQDKFLTQVFAQRRLEKGAEALGLDMGAYQECLDSGRPQTIIDRAQVAFDQRGLRGTPTIFVNGEKIEDYTQLEHLGEAQ